MNTSSSSLYLTRPDVLLRLEGLLELVVGCIAYQRLYPHHWGMFALLFLTPDLSLLGYLRPAGKAAATSYNLVHTYVLPLALGLLAWETGFCVGWPTGAHLAGAHQFRPVSRLRPEVSGVISPYPHSEIGGGQHLGGLRVLLYPFQVRASCK